MPFRALLYTLTTLMLLLLAIGMWLRATTPMLIEVNASTQASTTHPAATFPEKLPENALRPDRQFKGIVRAGLMASFVAVCILLTIGFFATLREWVRFRTSAPERRRKTKYVDAWRIAGERAQAEGLPEEPDEESQ